MSKLLVSHKKAKHIAFALFLVGIIFLSFKESWWPGILLVIGIPLSVKQYLLNKKYDVALTLFVFLGAFFSAQFNIESKIFLPILFITGGIYLLFRDLLEESTLSEHEIEEDINEEIEEKQHDK